MGFIDKCSHTTTSLQEMLVEYAFGRYDIEKCKVLFDALFVSAELMVIQSVPPTSPNNLPQKLTARAALMPLFVLADNDKCPNFIDFCKDVTSKHESTRLAFLMLDQYFNSEHGTVEILSNEKAAKAQSMLSEILA